MFNSEGLRQQRESALRIATGVVTGSIGPLLGALELVRRLNALGLHGDERFTVLVAVESDSDHLPVHPDDRKNWSAEALARKDAEAAQLEAEVRGDVVAACEALITELAGASARPA